MDPVNFRVFEHVVLGVGAAMVRTLSLFDSFIVVNDSLIFRVVAFVVAGMIVAWLWRFAKDLPKGVLQGVGAKCDGEVAFDIV